MVTDELNFTGGRAAKDALDNLRRADETSIDEARIDFDAKRMAYLARSQGKVGLRNLRIDGNTIHVDIKPVTFPVYTLFSKPDSSGELLDFSQASATAMTVITKDERLIIQHRGEGNELYGDMVGTSVAGYLDGKFPQKDKNGTYNPVDTKYIVSNVIKEGKQEIGLDSEDFKDVKISGIALDKMQPHDEFLISARSNLTSDEIREKARHARRNIKLSDEEFYEKFVDIPATPEAIQTLLTEVKNPIPPTHTAVLVATGYSLVLERSGLEEANKWKSQLEIGIRKNYQEIDEIVKSFYAGSPELINYVPIRLQDRAEKAVSQFKEKNPDATEDQIQSYRQKQLDELPKRKLDGYTPAYTPPEQGLPGVIEELKRTGLIIEDEMTKETNTSIPRAFLFDIDGVVTNPSAKKITVEALPSAIGERVNIGDIVSANTGRSISWLIEKDVVGAIERSVEERSKLSDVIMVGEKGGTWLTYENGKWITNVDESIRIPQSLQDEIRTLIETEFSNSMFFDTSKLTMISTEMIDGYDMPSYHKDQEILVRRLSEILAKEEYRALGLKIDPTTIATDIQNSHVGKHFGAKRIVEWLHKKGLRPEHFITVGDSQSDTEMAEELQDEYSTEFVFVGDRNKLDRTKLKCSVVFTDKKFEEGTLEYLQSLK